MIIAKYQKKFEKETYKGFKDENTAIETKRILNYYISDKYREIIIDLLMKNFNINEKKLVKQLYLNEQEIKEMARKGMIISAHTVNHLVMSKLSKTAQEKEIYPCFEFLDEIIKDYNNIKTYCHPYGGFLSFNKKTIKMLNKINCLFSLNVELRDVTKKDLQKTDRPFPDMTLIYFPSTKPITSKIKKIQKN